jgi:hypothetical protein
VSARTDAIYRQNVKKELRSDLASIRPWSG